jgi:hypothetical protein
MNEYALFMWFTTLFYKTNDNKRTKTMQKMSKLMQQMLFIDKKTYISALQPRNKANLG